MAILKSTQIRGDLSVTGSLNVQGNLTYVGVENLRVKDHQIELNANDKGSAASAGANADKAGIVIRGAQNTTKNPESKEASILYNYDNDSLVINKTIEGTVTSANNAASADKVANTLTINVERKAGSEEVVFDGSVAKTVSIDLKALQDQIDGKAAASHTHATSEITGLQAALNKKQDALTNADVLATITSTTQVSNWDDAATKAHVHANKTVLDGITADKVAAWDGAVSAAGVSSVGGKAGALTLKGGSETLGDVNLSISNTGEISAAIVPNSFDAKGAADAAKDAAIADAATKYQVKGNYEIAGAAATAEQNAKSYADGLAVNYDAKGSAASALADAKSYTDTEIGKLGTAAHRDVLTGAIADSSSDNLVTAAQVKAYAAGVVGAMHFRGAVESTGSIANPASGDICLVGTKEYVYSDGKWVLFGDESAYDTVGSAAAVLGKEGDDSTATTVYGVKAYAKKYADELAAGKADAKHTHKIADVTGLQGELDGKAAADHTHTIANVTGLSDALAGKAAASHTHAIADITDLQAALDAKQDDLSADQLNAVNSGITKAGVDNYEAHVANGDIHVTADDKKKWNAAQTNAEKYADGKVAELKNTVDSLSNDVLKGVAAGTYVSVSTKSNNSQTISVTTKDVASASDSANGLALAADVKKYVDGKNADQDTKIANIENGKTLDSRYVNADGDTMTGELTMSATNIRMPENGTNGIVFGGMKIVWNTTDNAIEFVTA